jgi:TonB family protein
MEDSEEGWVVRHRGKLVPLAIVLLVAGAILYFLNGTVGIHREAPPLPTLIATLPPPPPPPPQKPPEVEKKIEEVQKPVEEQPKVNDAPKPITINGPAQAGTDAFNIGAGSGGGDVVAGSGFGDANFGRFLSSTIQQVVQSDARTDAFVGTAEIDVWIDAEGRVTRASIARSSGDAKTDQDLIAVLEGMPALNEPPPASLQFPQRVRIGGKRRGQG